MPKIKPASAVEAAEHPREFSLLVNLTKDSEAPRQVRWPWGRRGPIATG